MTWKLNNAGDVQLAPVTGYTIAMFYDQVIALKLEFARSESQMRTGEHESEQVVMSPQIALEIGRALVERAELAMRPTGTPQA